MINGQLALIQTRIATAARPEARTIVLYVWGVRRLEGKHCGVLFLGTYVPRATTVELLTLALSADDVSPRISQPVSVSVGSKLCIMNI